MVYGGCTDRQAGSLHRGQGSFFLYCASTEPLVSVLPHPALFAPSPLSCRQQSQGLLPAGTAFDLFRGMAASARDEVETYPTQLAAKVTFGAKTHPEVRLGGVCGLGQ